MKKMLLRVAIVAMVLTIGNTANLLAGAVNPIGGIGTRAKGMGGAGAAIANDASVFYYNPALLSEAGNMVQLGMDYVRASIKYEDPYGGKHNSTPGEYWVPIAGAVYSPKDSRLSYGIGFVTPYMFGSDFKKELDMYSKIGLTNIIPAAAYRLSDSLSLGASVSIGHGFVEFIQPFYASGVKIGAVNSNADGYGYGYQSGLLWKPTEQIATSLSYQSKTKIDLKGRSDVDTIVGNQSDNFSASFYFPGRLNAGLSIKPIASLLIATDITWFDYSSTDKMTLHYDNLGSSTSDLDWKNSLSYNAGAEYELFENLKLRAGGGYQDLVIPDKTCNPITPDTNGWNVSAGFGWKNKNIGIDAAYVHAWGLKREVPTTYPGAGAYSADIDIISLATSYRW